MGLLLPTGARRDQRRTSPETIRNALKINNLTTKCCADQLAAKWRRLLLCGKFAHFQDPVPHCRALLRPPHGLRSVFDVDDVKPAQLLLRVRIRAVQDLRLAVFRPQSAGTSAESQPSIRLQYPRVGQRFRIRSVS